MQNRD